MRHRSAKKFSWVLQCKDDAMEGCIDVITLYLIKVMFTGQTRLRSRSGQHDIHKVLFHEWSGV